MIYRKQYSACGSAIQQNSKIFVTQAAIDAGLGDKLPYSKDKLLPVKNTRTLTKADMVRNDYCPKITVDPETYKVYIDGEHITCDPVDEVCLNHKYYFR
jgi:urease subunit alpha